MTSAKFSALMLLLVLASAAVTVFADEVVGTQEISLWDERLPSYLQYIQNRCALSANSLSATCQQLRTIVCGDPIYDAYGPCALFPGSYAYPENNLNKNCEYDESCKHWLWCPMYGADTASVRCMVMDPLIWSSVSTINPNSLVKWANYTKTCDGSNYDPATTSPATCGQLSGELCSSPDVDCTSGTSFYDTKLLQHNQKVVALTSDPNTITVSSVKPIHYNDIYG